jgi:hypothetical protein
MAITVQNKRGIFALFPWYRTRSQFGLILSVWRIRDVYSGSRILIFTHPGSRIPDPKTAIKDIGEKNLLSYLFLGVINFTKFNYFIFEML